MQSAPGVYHKTKTGELVGSERRRQLKACFGPGSAGYGCSYGGGQQPTQCTAPSQLHTLPGSE